MQKTAYIVAAATALIVGASPLAGAQSQPENKPDIKTRSQQIILGQPYNGPHVDTPRDQEGRPLLTGFWKVLHEPGKPDGNLAKDLPNFQLPYNEAGRETLAFNYTTLDPEARCLITGLPRILTSVLPFEILHTKERLATFHQLSWHRWVWLDGRERDPEQDPRYFGNSQGHWEGDTLVIETSGFHDSADGNIWLDDNANPISAEAVVIERWTRPDFHHLHLELTYTDPVYYTEPVTYKRSWVAGAPGEYLQEFSCEWNTAWILDHLERGPGEIGPNGNRGFGPDNQIVPDWPLGTVSGQRGTGYWIFRGNKPKPSDLPPGVEPLPRIRD